MVTFICTTFMFYVMVRKKNYKNACLKRWAMLRPEAEQWKGLVSALEQNCLLISLVFLRVPEGSRAPTHWASTLPPCCALKPLGPVWRMELYVQNMSRQRTSAAPHGASNGVSRDGTWFTTMIPVVELRWSTHTVSPRTPNIKGITFDRWGARFKSCYGRQAIKWTGWHL